uniref:Uncharacterized protein n=1 Tax=Panagrolaimus sp. PS1159 TaxID=55785 RepID=A0AC35FDM3_9BILA
MSNISTKNTVYIVLIILCSFLAFFLFPHSSREKYSLPIFNYSVPIQTKSAAVEESKKCFIQILNDWKKVEPIAWLEIVNLVKMCTKYIINYIPYLETTPHNPEHKYYMIPKIQYMNDSFYVITFGIGGDIDAELNIQMVIPHSKFLGFDPNENYETLFTGNLKGKFFQTAVGGKNVKNTTIMKCKYESHRKI